MAWIVRGSKESAEAAGADPERDKVIFAVTHNDIAKVYNRYGNNVDEDELGFEDRWELLSDVHREELLSAIEDYISKYPIFDEELVGVMYRMEARLIDEDLIDIVEAKLIGVMDEVEDRAAAEALK